MAYTANVNRNATCGVFLSALDHLQGCAGLVVQTTRAYAAPSKGGKGLTQKAVAAMVGGGCTDNDIRGLERGTTIPPDPMLAGILTASGFNMAAGGSGQALLTVLQTIRDNTDKLQDIVPDLPQ